MSASSAIAGCTIEPAEKSLSRKQFAEEISFQKGLTSFVVATVDGRERTHLFSQIAITRRRSVEHRGRNLLGTLSVRDHTARNTRGESCPRIRGILIGDNRCAFDDCYPSKSHLRGLGNVHAASSADPAAQLNSGEENRRHQKRDNASKEMPRAPKEFEEKTKIEWPFVNKTPENFDSTVYSILVFELSSVQSVAHSPTAVSARQNSAANITGSSPLSRVDSCHAKNTTLRGRPITPAMACVRA
jgi:hypothetical protein